MRAQPRTASYHASGKEALRVGLSLLDRSGDEVLVPSYAPVGVADAVRAAGASPRFYRVESPHEPGLASVEDAASESTMALVAVQYFGFPQARLGDLRQVAREHGAALVDDASHGPLGSVDGRALGASGDVGSASFHKPLNVPDGAVLYVDGASPAVGRRSASVERTRRVGTAGPHPGHEDLRYYAASAGAELWERIPALREPLRAAATGATTRAGAKAGGSGSDRESDATGSRRPTDGRRTDEAAWRGEMSWATRRELRRIHPDEVRRERRDAYRVWASAAADCGGVTPLFEELPAGACPWMFPLAVESGERRAVRLESRVAGAFRWPGLPDPVAGDAAFPTANRLARSVVCLPLRRPSDEAHARRLIGATDD
ncbi:DegT/DnrJ/EryC1/StrS aminotransferase [Halogeometricum pallidum JCM 14848]|uniref:DegT/DnrJ/EryC1/StrS aminotransferase n=1 Tax=Halogeometricum pallidum JCM 14848 TaxID=1227487 RepID=M0D2Y9_HALPD|nr:DegT/DnrJ/EryC1/StrS family aminotransferase [Halogeometricum pallidum]ELZ28494.1 DegT/DnrJ/EryC1/StrS aminotransferase [Halogeometricum pallidum JCM 14848]